MLERESLARACFIAQSKSVYFPEGIHLLRKVCINARTGTSVVMTIYTTVSKYMYSSLRDIDTYRAVTLGYDALKIL